MKDPKEWWLNSSLKVVVIDKLWADEGQVKNDLVDVEPVVHTNKEIYVTENNCKAIRLA